MPIGLEQVVRKILERFSEMAKDNQSAIIDSQGKLVVTGDIFVDIPQIDGERSPRVRNELKVLSIENNTAGCGLFAGTRCILVSKFPIESRHIHTRNPNGRPRLFDQAAALMLRVFEPSGYINCYVWRRVKALRILIGINGASGVIYGIRLVQVLSEIKNIETHLIITAAGERTIEIETEFKTQDVKRMANYCYSIDDIGAKPASGSFRHDGMIIAPCSMKTLAAIAHAYSENLLSRAADVTLKERRRLLLLVRETPLHLGHLKNMVSVTEMGGIVMPPVPAFYHGPQTIKDLIDHTIGKALDLFGVEHNLYSRWQGSQPESLRI